MKKVLLSVGILGLVVLVLACTQRSKKNVIQPRVVTEPVKFDTDDPAIWLNEDDPSASLIIGTDKSEDGALYVFGLDGKIIEEKVVRGLKRPNNVDIEEFEFETGEEIFIAVTTERLTNKIRVFSVPDMKAIDGGGIEIFEGESERAPMGISLYKRESDDAIFAIVSRKFGPKEGYLWQYRLHGNSDGTISAEKVREFGQFSGSKEIEAIAVDDEYGYVYYSDEGAGVRKYHADPDKGDDELALFGGSEFTDDREGISIYKTDVGTGYILVSDQQANKFQIYRREGEKGKPHVHNLIKTVDLATNESDGSEVINASLGETFPRGLFVAMSDDKTFHLYGWEDIAGEDLIIAPDGLPEHTKNAIQPKYVTEEVEFDTDDPAIWIHPTDPSQSLIIGTDKEDGGGLYVFDLKGEIVNKITGMNRPNNVDLAYGMEIGGEKVDIVVAAERTSDLVRVFSFPDMKPLDNGGIPVFEGEEEKGPMGLAMYTAPTGEIYAVVGRKDGPSGSYLWQYLVEDNGSGGVKFTKVRAFGNYSGIKEIEAIAVDNELGYIYYSDEDFAIRKYYADPSKGNEELAMFGTEDFGRDIEGISIYKTGEKTGYILVSDQQRGTFNVYPREGNSQDANTHSLITAVELMTMESDGSDVTSVSLGADFPKGMFVAMSTDKTFQIYDWRDIAVKISK